MKSRALKYGAIAALAVFIIVMLIIAIAVAGDPISGWIVIPAAIAIIGALVGIRIQRRKKCERTKDYQTSLHPIWNGN
jgi:hypothetical protein